MATYLTFLTTPLLVAVNDQPLLDKAENMLQEAGAQKHVLLMNQVGFVDSVNMDAGLSHEFKNQVDELFTKTPRQVITQTNQLLAFLLVDYLLIGKRFGDNPSFSQFKTFEMTNDELQEDERHIEICCIDDVIEIAGDSIDPDLLKSLSYTLGIIELPIDFSTIVSETALGFF